MGFLYNYGAPYIETADNTVWIDQGHLCAFCNVSENYLAKVRTLYKQHVGSSHRIVVGDSFFLPKSNKSWRWGFYGGRYMYSLHSIPNIQPTYYRSKLPTTVEILRQLDTIKRGSDVYRDDYFVKEVVGNYISFDDQVFFLMKFGAIKSRHLAKSMAWIKVIRRVAKFRMFNAYGFVGFDDMLSRCARIIARQNLEGLRISGADELREIILTAPDDDDQLRQYLISSE